MIVGGLPKREAAPAVLGTFWPSGADGEPSHGSVGVKRAEFGGCYGATPPYREI